MTLVSDETDAIPGAAACRHRYGELARECRENGFDEAALKTTLSDMSTARDGTWFLQPFVYHPTGIALGAPLHDAALTSALWAAAQRIAQHVGQSDRTMPFAFVPPEAYHVTVANRSHFEDGSQSLSMSPDTYVAVLEALRAIKWEPIALVFDGLLITRQGRLILAGVPANSQLARIRSLIEERFPELRPIPSTAHIKLGHLFAPPLDLTHALSVVAAEGVRFAGIRVDFNDLYTPVERIAL